MLFQLRKPVLALLILTVTLAHCQVEPIEQVPMGNSELTLADTVSLNQQIQIFSGLLRDVDPAWERLSDPSKQSVVLAPTNGALHNLPEKPWKKSSDVEQFGANAYDGTAGASRAQSNLESFVTRHIIPLGSDKWTGGEKRSTLTGREVWWEQKDGGPKTIKPDDIEVLEEIKDATNGETWLIKGVLQ